MWSCGCFAALLCVDLIVRLGRSELLEGVLTGATAGVSSHRLVSLTQQALLDRGKSLPAGRFRSSGFYSDGFSSAEIAKLEARSGSAAL